MGQKHSSAAIASKTNFVQRFTHILFLIHVHDFVLELFPLVGDHLTAAEATYWDYHLFSPIFKLLSTLLLLFLISIFIHNITTSIKCSCLNSNFLYYLLIFNNHKSCDLTPIRLMKASWINLNPKLGS